MSLSVLKTWSAGEVLTASDLNNEFSNIVSNATSLISPVTANFDLNGFAVILDGDGDTSITADSDDRIDVAVGGTDAVQVGHDATNASAFLLIDPGAFTAQANTDIARLHIDNDAAVTVPTGTTAIASALRVEEPNLTATGTITSAVTLYIAAAPTEGGTNNYALWVGAGATQLDGTLTVGGATTLSDDLTLAVSDSRTNSVDVPLIVRSTTSGTPAAGIGTGLQFDAESGDEDPSAFGRLDFLATDVSAGSEDTVMDVNLRTAGAALSARYRLAATGANNAIFTHANSSDRTYTLPNASGTLATQSFATGFNPGFITGGVPTSDTDTEHDVVFSTGQCMNAGETQLLTLPAYTKQGDAAFAEGDDAGGLGDTVSLPTSGTVYYFVITKDADGTVDYLIDTSSSGANVPSGWTVEREVWRWKTDGSDNLYPFTGIEGPGGSVTAILRTTVLSFNTTTGTSLNTITLTDVPAGKRYEVSGNAINAGAGLVHIHTLDFTDAAPSLTAAPLANLHNNASGTSAIGGEWAAFTNTSAQIGLRSGSDQTARLLVTRITDSRVV